MWALWIYKDTEALKKFKLVSVNKELFKNKSTTKKYFNKLWSHNNLKATHNSTMLKRSETSKDIQNIS
jgi:hypothetical protein